jgi:ubiquinone/menaquinone biosynthesis C-methylase UbiE
MIPYDKSGDHIYESGCGSGLGMLMTLELLRERNITNVTVHGNDYNSQMVSMVNRTVSRLARRYNGIAGKIRQAASINLSHVPDNTFDFVYTTSTSEIHNPKRYDPIEQVSCYG